MKVDNIYHVDAFIATKEIDDESIDLIITSPPYADRRKSTYDGLSHAHRDAWENCYHFTKMRKFYMDQDAVKLPIGDWAEKRMKVLSINDQKRSCSATGSGFGRNVSNWADKDMVFPDNVITTDALVDDVAGLLAQGADAATIVAFFTERNLITAEDTCNVVHLSAESGNRHHSAAFPEKLPEFFIKLFTKENDLVFDPFVGSGTSAKVACDLKRRFLGFELKKEYFDIAVKRLDLIDVHHPLFENNLESNHDD